MSDAAQSTAAPDAKPAEHHWWSGATDFAKGVGEGAWDAGKGMVQGVGSLATGAYDLATSADAGAALSHAATAAGQFAHTVATHPGRAADEVGGAVSGGWDKLSTAYHQAAAEGHGAEFLGKITGQAAVLVGTAFIPGGAEAEGVGLAADASRVAEIGSDAASATRARAIGDVAAAAGEDAPVLRGAVDAPAGAADSGSAASRFGRSEEEFAELAKDPAHGGKISVKSEQERRVGVELEQQGKVPSPLRREPTGAAEFVDGNGTKWDVKGFNSEFPANKGGFDLMRDASKVDKSLAQDENVMLDTSKMRPEHIAQLKAEGEARGWGDKVVFWP